MAAVPATDVLIEARGLGKHFPVRSGAFGSARKSAVRAVDGVDLSIRCGETLGLVGESGCGKSSTGRLLLCLIEPSAGAIVHVGTALTMLEARQMRERRRHMQIIFQDRYASPNPRMTVEAIIDEALRATASATWPRAGPGAPICWTWWAIYSPRRRCLPGFAAGCSLWAVVTLREPSAPR